jgi:hypothetical protein
VILDEVSQAGWVVEGRCALGGGGGGMGPVIRVNVKVVALVAEQ